MSRVTWETRNSTAFVVSNGVVRALAPGMGYVVARSGAATHAYAYASDFPRPSVGGMPVSRRVFEGHW